MATLISSATGNFTAGGTWKLADSASELDSEANNTQSLTVFVASSSFTPGAITIDAIAVKIASRVASPTGTFTVNLFNATLASSVVSVTINVSDINVQAGGWYVFPTGTILLLAATNYQIRIQSSVNSEVFVFRDATAGNWSRQLRTTTTQAPAAGDKLLVVGEHTGAGTGNSFTITMNSTATTSYGAVAFPQSVSCGKRAILQYGTAAATAYYLRVKGIVQIHGGGELDLGTTGTPMPSGSSGVLEFDPTVNVDSGLVVSNGGTLLLQGNPLTFDRTFLAADAAAAATTLTSTDSTGWLSGDNIVLASTTRTASESENKALSGNATGTSLPIAAITNAHSGTGATAGELANLTRNVVVRGISTSLNGYINIAAIASCNWDWSEILNMGAATGAKRGIDIATTTGSFAMDRCSVHDFTVASAQGLNISGASTNNIAVQNNIFYNVNNNHISINNATPNVLIFSGNLMIKNITTNELVSTLDTGLTFSSNTMISSTRGGFTSGEGASVLGTFSGNIAHSNAGTGIGFGGAQNGAAIVGGTISSSTCWRNASNGFSTGGNMSDVIFDGITAFGNTTSNVNIGASTGGVSRCYFNNLTLNAGTTLTCPVGIQLGILVEGCFVTNSSLGATTSHATGDINFLQPGGISQVLTNLTFQNTLLSSPTPLANQSLLENGSIIGSEKHNQTAGSHKAWLRNGIITTDTVIFNLGSPSARLTPNTASFKLEIPPFRIPMNSGTTETMSISVRKSVVGDGTAYNGNQPRLIVKRNPAMGIAADTVLATAAGAAGSWESLSGTTPTVTDAGWVEIVVDCDGTTGWVNIDDFISNAEPDTGTLKYWFNGSPFAVGVTDDSAYYTDPGVANVRLATTYQYNSLTPNRTGTLRSPSIAQVKIGVVYDSSDSLTGTYDGSDRWTDPGVATVLLGTVYKANSTTNNRTGTVRLPGTSDVRNLLLYGPSDTLTGTLGDGTPPVFAGISTLVANADGSLTATWSAATDPATPIRYDVFMQSATATGLFSTTPFGTQLTSITMYALPGGGALTKGTVYYIGVRAFDDNGNEETNTISLSATSNGVVDGVSIYQAHGAFSIDPNNLLTGTLWATLDDVQINFSLGTASYTIFDNTGTLVGISQSGISPLANGQYIITPVAATPITDMSHYIVQIDVVAGGQARRALRPITSVSGLFDTVQKMRRLINSQEALGSDTEVFRLS